MTDVHPDMASASLQAAVVLGLADEFRRHLLGADLAVMWGADVQADFMRRSDGMDDVSAELLCEEMHAEQMAKPRPGPRGFLSRAVEG
jgi:hypothetical protein